MNWWYEVIDEDDPMLVVNGSISISNPHGYLSDDLYTSLKLHIVLAILYFLVWWVWLIVLCFKRTQLIRIHYYILVLISVSTFETILNLVHLGYMNFMGEVNLIIVFIPGILKMIKLGLANLLILYLSLGYGVVWLPSDFKQTTIIMIWVLCMLLLVTIMI